MKNLIEITKKLSEWIDRQSSTSEVDEAILMELFQARAHLFDAIAIANDINPDQKRNFLKSLGL